jgi:hypothetical protein
MKATTFAAVGSLHTPLVLIYVTTACIIGCSGNAGHSTEQSDSAEPSLTVTDVEAEKQHQAEMERWRMIIAEQEREEAEYRTTIEKWDRQRTNIVRVLQDPYFYSRSKVKECLAKERQWGQVLYPGKSISGRPLEREPGWRERAADLESEVTACWAELLTAEQE